MPRIPNEILDAVIFLYRSSEAAQMGDDEGGSGFLLSVPSAQTGWSHVYGVTALHVIANGASVVRTSSNDVIAKDSSSWIRHPDGLDVAVCSLGMTYGDMVPTIPIGLILTESVIEEWDLGPGNETFFVGRFRSHQGTERNLPSARFGNISMMPGEPVMHPLLGPQPSFLVEGRSLSGYSGSPVFVYRPYGTYGGDTWHIGSPLDPDAPRYMRLLGVDWGHVKGWEPQLEIDIAPKEVENAGMVAAIPAWELLEIFEEKEIIAMRDAEEQELEEKLRESNVTLDSAPNEEEFGRFRKLAGGLLSVPKKELSQERRKQTKRR